MIDNKRKRSLAATATKSIEADTTSDPGVVCKTFFNKLIVNVSDKLRSPLFVIKSYSQLLQKTQEEDKLKRGFQLMETAAIRMEKTIAELINVVDIYTNEVPERHLIFFREMFEKAQINLSDQLKNTNISISTDFGEFSKIWFNKPFLEAVFTELISNAILHNPDQDDLEIKISSYKLINSVVLQIEDNGSGFKRINIHEGIKDPFNTQSQLPQCVGVGLSKVEAIAKVTNAVFDVESSSEMGTICRFYFR